MYRDKLAFGEKDKHIADEILQLNLTEWIWAKSWPVIRDVRLYRAATYVNAVHDWGDSSFWCDGKSKPSGR